jgi:aryl-alcohol dehydrogenase-like predicted oxidoreductase
LNRIRLGCTKLQVSRLCFGTEPFAIKKGPDGAKSQGDLTPEEGGDVLRDALALGVNFWDTSDDYGTHPHVRVGLSLVDRKDVVITDKSNALTYQEGRKAIALSKTSLDTDYVDLMLLHNVPARTIRRQDSTGHPYVSGSLNDRRGALKAFHEARETGEVRATGLSTHSTAVLREALDVPVVEVVCTTLNMAGALIDDGTLDEHLKAIRALKEAGKGIYVIKLLYGGRLREEGDTAIKYALQFREYVDAWNIGMYDTAEVERNLALIEEALRS